MLCWRSRDRTSTTLSLKDQPSTCVLLLSPNPRARTRHIVLAPAGNLLRPAADAWVVRQQRLRPLESRAVSSEIILQPRHPHALNHCARTATHAHAVARRARLGARAGEWTGGRGWRHRRGCPRMHAVPVPRSEWRDKRQRSPKAICRRGEKCVEEACTTRRTVYVTGYKGRTVMSAMFEMGL